MRSVGIAISLLFLFSCSSYYGLSKRALRNYYISLETTPCFGRCPILKLEVNGNAQALLNAKRFTDSLGVFRMKLEPTQMRKLTKASALVDWKDLKNEYLSNYSDLPSRIIRYSVKPGDTIVVRYEKGEAPKDLEDLGVLLYELTDRDHPWKRMDQL